MPRQGFGDFPVISSITELVIAPAVRKNAPSRNSFLRTRLPSSSIYNLSVRSTISALPFPSRSCGLPGLFQLFSPSANPLSFHLEGECFRTVVNRHL